MNTTNTGAATMTVDLDVVVISTHKTEKAAFAGQRKALREGRTNVRIIHERPTTITNERFLIVATPQER